MPYGVNTSVSFNKRQYVYSYRTGKRAAGFPPIPPSPKPNGGGDLLNVLKKRKQFYEDLDQHFQQETTGRIGRFSRADFGHTFVSIKSTLNGGRASFEARDSKGNVTSHWTHSGLWPEHPYVPSTWPLVPNPAFLTQSSTFGGIFEPNQTATLNRLFDSTVPDNAGLGETIVEIVSGNLPKLLTSSRKLLTKVGKDAKLQRIHKDSKIGKQLAMVIKHGDGKTPSWLKAGGKDFLEVQFGVAPVISQVLDIVKILMDISGGLVDESTRMNRTSPRFSESSSKDFLNKTSFTDPSSKARRNRGTRPAVSNDLRSGLALVSPFGSTSRSFSQDHRLSLRATLAGRDTGGFEKFYDDLPLVVQKMGMWYPGLLWDLIPYSWLVDWVLHIGAAIDRVAFYSPSGKMPLDYAYLTTKYFCSVEQSLEPSPMIVPMDAGSTWVLNGSGGSMYTTGTYRRAVTPFGIGTSLGTLTNYQFSILVALGLARGR